ncbi:MAG: hypothetical protein A2068_09345 [Ignavibacteria bacterium GWB2_35_6b]|nr:MAG: hypothetical protein A2068_09345 [Ignavibacteria bacterium GWB2_35_6b]
MIYIALLLLLLGISGLITNYNKSQIKKREEESQRSIKGYDPNLIYSWSSFVIGFLLLIVLLFKELF